MKTIQTLLLFLFCSTLSAQTFLNAEDSLSLQEDYYKLVRKKSLPQTLVTGGVLGGMIGLFPTANGQVTYALIVGAANPIITMSYIKRARVKATEELEVDPELAKKWDYSFRDYRKRKKDERKQKKANQ